MKNKRSLIITVVITFLMQIFSGIIPLFSVNAEEITSFPFITGVSITDKSGNDLGNDVSKSSEIHLNYTWSIPNEQNVAEGDYYQMQLPGQINIVAAIDQPINDTSGNKIADMHIGTGGAVKIIFSKYASEHSNVHGSFYVDCFFKESTIGNLNPVVISFYIPAVADPVNVEVNFQQPDPTITKSGSYNPLTDEITWTLTANKEGVRVDNASLSDLISSGQVFKDGSVIINGTAADSTSYNYDTTNKKLSINLGNITAQQVITFKTSVHGDLASKSQGTYNYSNFASLNYTDNGSPKTITSNTFTVPVSVSYISKNGSYDSGNKKINWTITVNGSGRTINNAVVTDTLPTGLTLIDGTVKSSGTYTVSGQNVVFNLGNINTVQTITFSASVDISVYNSNKYVSYTNKAVLTGDNVPSGTSASKTVGFTPNIISKAGTGYDSSTGIISWKITVNSNTTLITAGAVVTDNILIGQKYVNGTAKLNGNNLSDDNVYTQIDGDMAKTGIFKYTFSDSFSNTQVITFQTQVTDPKSYRANYSGTYYNTANLTAPNINENTTGSQKVSSEVISKTGAGYNYATRETTWKIVVNKNKMPVTNAVITDDIPTGQEYVDGSANIDNGGSTDGFNYIPIIGDSIKTGTLTYTFPQGSTINNTYIITFRTKLTDINIFNSNGTKTLTNNASISADDIPADGNRAASGTQNINNTVINKTSSYTNGNSYIDWTMNINSNFSIPLSGAAIADTLQQGLALDTDTVELYKAVVNPADGSLTQGNKVTLNSNNVRYNPDTREFVFTFGDDASGAYILKFRTYANQITTYTNTAVFTFSTIVQQSNITSVGVWYSTGGGTGTGESGSITVIKTDSSDSAKKLSGAVFQLLDQYGNVKYTSSPTGSDGTAVFDKLKYDLNYSIKEITPPVGYNLSSEVYTFQVNGTTGQKDITYNYKDEILKGDISFTKTGEDVNGLPGAVFTLYNQDGITSVLDSQGNNITAVSDGDGEVTFKDVSYGSYKIKESSSPEGYNLSSDVISAVFSGDYNNKIITVTPNTVSNTKIYGGMKITKADSVTEKPLSGTAVAIYTSDGNLVGSIGVTGTEGTVEFDNLLYGDYYYLENSAPEGYNLNTDKHYFSIKENGVLLNSILTDSKITGTVEISKKDKAGIALQGAEFTIYDENGNAAGTAVSDADGIASFPNVEYGSYTIKETKAPVGYNLSYQTLTAVITQDGAVVNADPYTVYDTNIAGTVNVSKTDENGNALQGAEFTIYDENGNAAGTAVSGADGIASFTNVKYGSYTIKETKAPVGYTASDKKVSVQVTENGKYYEAGTFTDTKIRASILIKKLDQDGNPLQGAEFTLYDGSGNALETVTSESDGTALFKDVLYGNYTLKESKIPEGYKQSQDEIKINVTENGSTYSYEVDNNRIKGTIEINTTDSTGKVIPGAEYTLYDQDGKAVATAVSDKNGNVRFEDVDYGIYTIEETETPSGYAIFGKKINININSSETQRFTLTNSSIKLPKTGGFIDTTVLLLLGITVIAAGLFIVLKNKKKNN